MPVNWAWGNETKTVVRFTFVDPWSWHEFNSANDEAGIEAASFNHVVDAIFDFRGGRIMPAGAVPMFTRAARESITTPSQGITVVIGMQSYMYAIYDVIARIYPPVVKIVRLAVDDEAASHIIEAVQAQRLSG